jgi:23S rRNA (adenine2503-C2)-methyltransferase
MRGFSELDAKRVFPWIHLKLAHSFDVMSDVPKNVRESLPSFFSIERPKCKIVKKSFDDTQKALLEFDDCGCVETVYIPEKSRGTICVSSQIGCSIGCKFCHTGVQKFSRNLTSSEIMSQIFFWKDMLLLNKNYSPITNVVFMGMGEPFLNHENLFSTLDLLLDGKIHNFSRKKITVSTSGVILPISAQKLSSEDEISYDSDVFMELAKFGVKLAISLHAADDDKRTSIVPINKKYGIAEILEKAKEYLKASNTEYITFEYLLLSEVNDSDEDALSLAKLLQGFRNQCKVNIILFNDWPGSLFKRVSTEKANNFSRILLAKGIRTIIRKSRGEDISAACGQLKTESLGTF